MLFLKEYEVESGRYSSMSPSAVAFKGAAGQGHKIATKE